MGPWSKFPHHFLLRYAANANPEFCMRGSTFLTAVTAECLCPERTKEKGIDLAIIIIEEFVTIMLFSEIIRHYITIIFLAKKQGLVSV